MDLTQYFKSVIKWWWLLILSTVIAAGASYYATSKQPLIYQTTTTLLVGQVTEKSKLSASDFSTVEQLAESYAQIAVRQPVLQATVDSLQLQLGWQALKQRVNASQIPGTQLLGITVKDQSPKRAVAIADEIARQLILQTPTSLNYEERTERSEFVQSQLDDLETRIQKAQTRINELEAEVDTAFSARKIQDLQSEIAGLEKLINNWQVNYADLLNFYEGGDDQNSLTVIEPAQLPTRPVSPKVSLNIMVAAIVGLALALAAALFMEFLDDTIRSVDDLTSGLGLTALGSVNRIPGQDHKGRLITNQDHFSPVSEAYRMMRVNLQFMADEQPAKSILVTSCNPAEGKSITAANLAVVMAQAGLKTIIVDADLRQSTLHKIFRVPNQGGLADLLRLPEPDIEGHLKNSEAENLQVITSGALPPDPSELLSLARVGELLQRLEALADVVIIDTPPILAVTDAAVLSSRVDGVILLAEAKQTRRDDIKQAIKRLDWVGANFLGVVLNKVPGSAKEYYRYAAYSGSRRRSGAKMPVFAPRRWWQRLSLSK